MVPNVYRNHKENGGKGVWRWGKREIIYIALHFHLENDSCIKIRSDGSHFNVSLIVRDMVTRQCPQTTTFFYRKRNRAEALPLTSLKPYLQAKPAYNQNQQVKSWLQTARVISPLFLYEEQLAIKPKRVYSYLMVKAGDRTGQLQSTVLLQV